MIQMVPTVLNTMTLCVRLSDCTRNSVPLARWYIALNTHGMPKPRNTFTQLLPERIENNTWNYEQFIHLYISRSLTLKPDSDLIHTFMTFTVAWHTLDIHSHMTYIGHLHLHDIHWTFTVACHTLDIHTHMTYIEYSHNNLHFSHL